jgi:hypothetical protein
MAAAASAAQQPVVPDFVLVSGAVDDFFATLPDYEHGDLITQSQIAQALDNVREAGWDVPVAERIVKLGLADDSFLAKELCTPAGRKFMRKISAHPGAYARLERLSTIARGKSIVRDLVNQPGGDKMIEYLATTDGGQRLGSMLSGARQGANLNQPTGRIYTAEDLIGLLQRMHEKARAKQ